MRLVSASPRTLAAGALLLALLGSGCAPDPRPVVFDLGAGLPFADLRTEVETIDLGAHQNRWHLADGWRAESWYKRRSAMFVIQGAEEAALRFRLLDPVGVTLRLYGRPYGEWGPEDARFQVAVNGRTIGSAAVRRDLRWYEFQAPADALVAGTNELTIHWPAVTDSSEPPTFGWFELQVARSEPTRVPTPRYRADDSSLSLPAHVRVDYHLRVPEDAELRIASIAPAVGDGGLLEVLLGEDGVEAVALDRVEAPRTDLRVDLSEYAGRVVRLSLEAVPAGDGGAFSGLLVESPVIVAAPRSDPSAVTAGVTTESDVEATLPSGPRNVIVYVVDTLRQDHLGAYGYPRPVSPELDRFAADATLFENAVGQSSWTRASMASVFTGLGPISHATNGRKDILAPEAETLAEILGAAGYRTMAIVLNHNVFPVFGFDQGIDQYTKMTRGGAALATETFLGWLDRREEEGPFFAWLHPVNPHDPYLPPPDLRERFDDLGGEPIELTRPPKPKDTADWSSEQMDRVVRHLRNLYDAEIASNDRAFGELLAGLDERGLLDSTLIIFVSDHGEEFQEHGGWTHGHNLYVETLDVPLVMRFPELGRGARVGDVVQHIDILPTVLDYLGVDVPDHVEGRSLLPLVRDPQGDEARDEVPAFSFVDLDGRPHYAIVDGDWKLMQRLESSTGILSRLYDRSGDREETVNLVLERPILARYLERIIEARAREQGLLTTSEAELDEETENALRALGYLQ